MLLSERFVGRVHRAHDVHHCVVVQLSQHWVSTRRPEQAGLAIRAVCAVSDLFNIVARARFWDIFPMVQVRLRGSAQSALLQPLSIGSSPVFKVVVALDDILVALREP